MRLNFAPITDSDEPFLLALYSSTRADEMAMVPWDDLQKNAFLQSQFRSQIQHYSSKYPQGRFETVIFNERKIGRLYVCELEDEVRILDLTILPELRGGGFGTEIISDILQNTAKPVRINLESFNRSVGLFRRLGFRVVNEDGFYQLWEGVGNKSLNAAG